ncbi:hypothetical protein EB796_012274 [Bugula neritina]|uniref:Uncharacterized protein n=1 Tax=Bugula neritina TaxID=10212 RepID=A0A7J7JU06_BUGNE|nr:hypothetical protein EB796_012274 [Bugula neritina]
MCFSQHDNNIIINKIPLIYQISTLCHVNEICCPASTCGGSQCVKQSTRKSPPSNNRCPAIPRKRPAICKQVRVGFTCKRGQPCPRAGEICCPGKCGGTACVRRGGNQPAALG